MKTDFLHSYQQIFHHTYKRLKNALTLKLKAMKVCGEQEDVEDIDKFQLTEKFGENEKIDFDEPEEGKTYQVDVVSLKDIDKYSINQSSK